MPDAICLRAECGGWRILLDIELSTERLLGYEGAECRREFVLSRDHNAAELHLLRLVHQLAQRALQFDAYRTTRASAKIGRASCRERVKSKAGVVAVKKE